jgi:hypothetical protein
MSKVSLDVLSVKNPCPESWDAMEGDDEARSCGVCRMTVYDLSAMTRERAEQLVAEREGRLCVRFYRRADGTVSTADCAPIRFAALRRTARRTLGAAAALFASLLTLVVGLGLFRLSDVDVASWLEDGPLGRLAKAMDPDPVIMGEMPPSPHELGEALPEPELGDVAVPAPGADDRAVGER